MKNVKLDKTFIDRASGNSTDRPELKKMLTYLRDGDRVMVYSMDRLARNLDDLRKIVKQLTEQKIIIEFIKENLIFTGEDSPISNLLLSVMGAFAEFEKSLIKERQREGIELAKKKGIYKGRKASLTPKQIVELKKRVEGCEPGKVSKSNNFNQRTVTRQEETQEIKDVKDTKKETKTDIAKAFGISRETLYRYLRG
jgi:DNA invertase Pin-like site-specific DNA recombinase